MSNQLQITGGAKVRNLEGVLTGTSGVVNALAINVPNGIPQLDGSGKILVSQLPNSVMEYKGTWDASTNTPTLVNGTGNQGDVYLCNVAGTVNFGAGPITFAVGDQVIYSGTIWQKAGGSTGTVTSVAITESGDSLNITGSPITTSGTINIGFNGTNLQYINGAGDLTTFPSLTGYVPYTGATGDVDLGVFKLNAASMHIKGTAGNGHLGLKHQSASPTGSANESLIFADVNGDLGWLNDNLYLNKFVTSANTANRSYTFPNATGTVALTSDLSSYVPYTGATANVNLGTFDLSAYAVSADILEARLNGTASSPLILRTGTSGFAAGLNAISLISSPSIANTLSIISDVSSVTKTAQIGLGSLSATRTYTLPDASGTLALLESSQTFTGINTFSSASRNESGILLKNGFTTYSNSYTSLGGNIGNLIISGSISGTPFDNELAFTPSTSNTYTFPAATGTVALTSDLSSYVPYTSATSNVDLGGFSLYLNNGQAIFGRNFTGTTAYALIGVNPSNKVQIDASALGTVFGGTIGNGTYTYTLPSATGTLALGTGTTNYHAKFTGTNTLGNSLIWDNGTNVGIGNTNTSYTLDVSGTGRFTGALALGGALNITVPYSAGTMTILTQDNLGNGIYLAPRSNLNFDYGVAGNTNGIINNFGYQNGSAHFRSLGIGNGKGGTIAFFDGTSGNVGIGTSSPQSLLQVGAFSGNNAITIGGATDGVSSLYFGDGTGAALYRGFIEYQHSGDYMRFGTSATEQMRITSAGQIYTSNAPVGDWSMRVIGSSSTSNSYGLKVLGGTNSSDLAFSVTPQNGSVNYIYVRGDGYLYSASAWSGSDRRLKENITDLDNGLDKVLNLKPRKFDFIDSFKNQFGFIAQEVQEVIPDAVSVFQEEDQMLAIKMDFIIPHLVAAIQEMNTKLDEQNQTIQNLQEQINILAK